MKTDTPRTDELVKQDRPSYCHYRVYARMVDLARELESDLNLVRKLLADESRDSRVIFENLEAMSKELNLEQIRSDGRLMLLHGQEARHKEEIARLKDGSDKYQVVARNALYELERLLQTGDTHALPQIIQNLKQFLP